MVIDYFLKKEVKIKIFILYKFMLYLLNMLLFLFYLYKSNFVIIGKYCNW